MTEPFIIGDSFSIADCLIQHGTVDFLRGSLQLNYQMLGFLSPSLTNRTRQHEINNPPRAIMSQDFIFILGNIPLRTQLCHVCPKNLRKTLIRDRKRKLFTKDPSLRLYNLVQLRSFQELLLAFRVKYKQLQPSQEVKSISDRFGRGDDRCKRSASKKFQKIILNIIRQL